MEATHGRILSVDANQARATVQVDATTFCARCASGKGCGAGVFGSDNGPRKIEAPILGPANLKSGDKVRIELAPRNVLQAAVIVYGVPLAAVLISTGLAWLAGFSDMESLVAAGIGLVLGVAFSRYRLRRRDCLRQFTPAITRRLAPGE